MKYITILDFERGETHIFPYLEWWSDLDFLDIIESIKEGYNIEFFESNCQWMIQDTFKLEIHG